MNRSALRWVGAAVVPALAVGGLAWLPDTASATFTAAVSVSQTGYDSDEPRVAVDRQGDALLAWVRMSHTYPYEWRVQVRSRSHTGAWGGVVTLSPVGQAPRSPKVAVDDDGDAVVAWDAFNGTDYRVYARRVSRYGAVGPVMVLSGAGLQIHGTDLAVDPDGDAVVTWAEWHSDGQVFPMLRRFSRGGALGAATRLAASPARAEPPAVALDRDSDAVLAWANDNVVQARTLSAGGTWGPLRTVSADLSPIDRHFAAKVTVDRDGDALVTWRHWTAADQTTQVWGRWLSRDGALGAVGQLTPAAHPDVVNYSVSGDLDGDVMLSWDRFQNHYLYARQITRTHTVGPPVLLDTNARLHTIRVDDDGDGVVVWQGAGINGSVGSIRARRLTQAGTFWSAQVVTSSGVSPTAAVNPATGAAVAAWERRFQVDLRIQASVGP